MDFSKLEMIPRKRTALDGLVWWCIYSEQRKQFITGARFKTKKRCKQAIDNFQQFPILPL
jgi:hypothetical protein